MKSTRERQAVNAPGARVASPGLLRRMRPSALPTTAAAGVERVVLDPVIHERTRLAILTALMTLPEGGRTFLDLRAALHLTDGNLTTHLRTLGEAGLVELLKKGAGRGSSTTVQLTPAGRRAFQNYLDRLESLIHAARGNGERNGVAAEQPKGSRHP